MGPENLHFYQVDADAAGSTLEEPLSTLTGDLFCVFSPPLRASLLLAY